MIFPGYEPGSESNPSNWPAWITGASRDADLSNSTAQGQALQQFFGNGFFAYFVFEDPHWDFRTLNFTTDVTLTDEDLARNPQFDRSRPQAAEGAWRQDHPLCRMGGFRNRSDQTASTTTTASGPSWPAWNLVRQNGDRWEEIQEFYRLFMVPGMAHCSGGDGPNAFGNGTSNGPMIDADHDLLKALERWVEQGVAPIRLLPRIISYQFPLISIHEPNRGGRST